MSLRPLAVHFVRASALVLLLAASGVTAFADQKPLPDGAPPLPSSGGGRKDAKATPEFPFADWSKVTKDATRKDGMFATWTKRDTYYWEVRKNQLGKPFLVNAHFSRGIGMAYNLGGLPIANGMVQFERMGDKIFLVMPQTRIVATGSDSAYKRAVDLSFGNSILHTFKIESEKDSTVLVDMTSLFLSDALDLSTRLRGTTGKGFRFDRERSAITSHKAFPKNMEVEALLTFSPGDRENLNLVTVPDSRFVPMSVHYSFLELPEKPMVPRVADERVGYFAEAVQDMSKDYRDDYWFRYIKRWRLEKKDPAAPISEPVKPIVYYIDHTVPVEWRPAVKAGIEEWNRAFEQAGFRNAIVAKDAPNDPDWDAEDARYSTIRWITSAQPSFGAIGPSQVDPRTGEILNADILMEGSMIMGYSNGWRRWVGPTASADEMLGIRREQATKMGLDPSHLCEAGAAHADHAAFLSTSLMLNGLMPAGEPVPKEYVAAGLKAVVMHEVGHTLGLRHNFQSSTAVPMERLHDKAWVAQNGLVGSIMDYDTPNISPDPARQGYYWSPTVGTYDLWAIKYGYTPTSATASEDDYKLVAPIARESTLPGNTYATDEDTYPADALDPRNNIFDLGSDPLAFSMLRVNHINGLWQDPNLENKVMKDGDPYLSLRLVMNTFLGQYSRGLSHARKYVGGQYANRARKGDPNSKGPFQHVPAAEQRKAMEFIADKAFSPAAFEVSPQLLDRVGNDRHTDWGNNTFAYGRQDYPFLTRVRTIQVGMMNALLEPALLSRMREAEARVAEPFSVGELFGRMTGSIMSELGVAGSVPSRTANLAALAAPNTRRDLQRAYVDRLADIVTTPVPGMPEDAEALARLHLTRISDACQKGLASPALGDDTVRAHLLEMRARATQALEAKREVATASMRPGFFVAPPAAGAVEAGPGVTAHE